MTYDPTGHLLLTPIDKDAPARVQRLHELGLGERPEPAFDEFAHRLADVTGAPFSMVNFIDENRQFFAGLHTPEGTHSGSDLGAAAAGAGGVGRVMARDHGDCPHGVGRRKALGLGDGCAYPRFAGVGRGAGGARVGMVRSQESGVRSQESATKHDSNLPRARRQ